MRRVLPILVLASLASFPADVRARPETAGAPPGAATAGPGAAAPAMGPASAPDPDTGASAGDEPPPFVVGGVAVAPGEKREIRLRASESFAATDVEIPVVVLRGPRPGPTLCLVAGVHGDELNGIEIVREILETHQAEDLSGTLVGVPIVNLFGFTTQSRYLPDRRDLNRHFPGNPNGSTASRIAWRLWTEVIGRCTHLIDFHTGSLHRSNVPQLRGDLRRPAVEALAQAFGARVVVHNPGQRGTLRRQAVEAGIPSLLYEAGETLRFQKAEIRRGVLGTRNVMVHLGMRPGRRVDLGRQSVYVETRWVRAQQGGILDLYPGLGEWVEKGDILGVVTDPLRNERGLVTSPFRGQVVGKVLAPMVIPGMAIVHLGIPGGRIGDGEADQEEMEAERPE